MVWGSGKLKRLIEEGKIKNTYEGCVNPASINVRLGDSYLKPAGNKVQTVSRIWLGDESAYLRRPVNSMREITILPGEFLLGTTIEYVDIPKEAAVFVQGRSSIGRIGLTVQNAGFVDPGFSGCITLELKNDAVYPIVLKYGYPVAQLVFMDATEVEEGYHGKYVGQTKATGSRMQQDSYKGEDGTE